MSIFICYLSIHTLYKPHLDCPTGQYGQKCEHSCHCANNDPCPNFTGYCPHGCAANWAGSRCDNCTEGWTGDDCDKSKIGHLHNVYQLTDCIILYNIISTRLQWISFQM